MQTFSAAPYLQNQVTPKKDYSPTQAAKSDNKGSFTDALDQELAQGQGVQDKEHQTSTEEQTAEGKGINTIPWPIQMPYMQETLMTGIQMQKGQTAEVQPEIGSVLSAAGPEEVLMTEMQMQAEAVTPKSAVEGKMQGAAELDGMPELITVKDMVKNLQQAANHSEVKPENAGQINGMQMQVQTQESTEQNQESSLKEMKTAPELAQVSRPELAGKNVSFEQPVKTAQTSTVDLTEMKEGLQKLSKAMAENMAKGRTEFEIWLEPANLGKLSIKVAYETGRAAVSIMCMNEKTMEIISQNAKNLGVILEQNTGTDTVVVVDHPESDYLQQHAEKDNQNGYDRERQNTDGSSDNKDPENQSFLQQLRLGLM